MSPSPRRARIPGLAVAAVVCFAAAAKGLAPPPVVLVSEWAAEKRIVAAEEGGPLPGKWSNETTPYLVEPMDCCSLARRDIEEVTLKKSAQLGGTQVGLNLMGSIIDVTPANLIYSLPSLEVRNRFISQKVQPTIDSTPCLSGKVLDVKSRDSDGSTKTEKKFKGGRILFTGANSSKDLQTVTARVAIREEISEYPWDLDGRGDPVAQIDERLQTWIGRGRKVVDISTPAIEGRCRISAKYEKSDQRRYYVPCPHCGAYQVLEWARMRKESAAEAAFVCAANGCVMEQHHRRGMVALGVAHWIKTYPGDDKPPEVIQPEEIERHKARSSAGRHPGFWIWAAYGPFKPWGHIVQQHLDAGEDPTKFKVFTQQVLGEAWSERRDTPDFEQLYQRREPWRLGSLPQGVLFLTGAADVQGNRIEYLVEGWGIGWQRWTVDKGQLPGDTTQPAVWYALREVVQRTYSDAAGYTLGISRFAVDTGFQPNMGYWFASEAHQWAGDKRVYAVKGVGREDAPAMGVASTQEVTWKGRRLKGGALLWPVGVYDLKKTWYANLRNTIAHNPRDTGGVYPPGYVHFPADLDEAWFKQATAENLVPREDKASGMTFSEWVLPRGQRNEALDLYVYSTAMAYARGIHRLKPEEWLAMAAERGAPPEQAQMDLALWHGVVATAAAPGDASRANGIRTGGALAQAAKKLLGY